MLHLTLTRLHRRGDPRPAFLVRAYASRHLLAVYTTPHRRSALQEARRALLTLRRIHPTQPAPYRLHALRSAPDEADLSPPRPHILRAALAKLG